MRSVSAQACANCWRVEPVIEALALTGRDCAAARALPGRGMPCVVVVGRLLDVIDADGVVDVRDVLGIVVREVTAAGCVVGDVDGMGVAEGWGSAMAEPTTSRAKAVAIVEPPDTGWEEKTQPPDTSTGQPPG